MINKLKLSQYITKDERLAEDLAEVKDELICHSEGYVPSSYVSLYQYEETYNTDFAIKIFEPITKDGLWRGVDNLMRIFKSSAFAMSGDSRGLKELLDNNFNEFVLDCFKTGLISDPNAIIVPFKEEKWVFRLVMSEDILQMNDEYVSFRVGVGEYKREKKYKTASTKNGSFRLYRGHKKNYEKYINYIVGQNAFVKIENSVADIIDIDIKVPYIRVGAVAEDYYNTALSPYLSYANTAIDQFRNYRINESLHGYIRMSEVQDTCNDCYGRGQVPCNTCEDSNELESCNTCKGTGRISVQSAFNVYIKKQNEDPSLNITSPMVEFYHPSVDILNYTKEAWLSSIEMGKQAIYLRSDRQTGNVESAEAKELNLQSMYSWLDRVAGFFFANISKIVGSWASLSGFGEITIEKPKSYEILTERASIEYVNNIFNSNAPQFVKSIQIEEFVNKYISHSNKVYRVIQLCKQVNKYWFMTFQELSTMNNMGLISDEDTRNAVNVYPEMLQLVSQIDITGMSDEQIIELWKQSR
jgi:hypothetical protein